MNKENIELAEEHVKIAEDLVLEEAKECDEKNKENIKHSLTSKLETMEPRGIHQFENKKALKDAAFSLEKAEANLEELD